MSPIFIYRFFYKIISNGWYPIIDSTGNRRHQMDIECQLFILKFLRPFRILSPFSLFSFEKCAFYVNFFFSQKSRSNWIGFEYESKRIVQAHINSTVKEFHNFNHYYHFIKPKMWFKSNWKDFDKSTNNRKKNRLLMGISQTVTKKIK